MQVYDIRWLLLAIAAQPFSVSGQVNCTDGVRGAAPTGTRCVFPATYVSGINTWQTIRECATHGFDYNWCCVESVCTAFAHEQWGSCGECPADVPPSPPAPAPPPVPVLDNATYVGKGVCRDLNCEIPGLLATSTINPVDQGIVEHVLGMYPNIEACVDACINHESQACGAVAYDLNWLPSVTGLPRQCYLYGRVPEGIESLRGSHDIRYPLCPNETDAAGGFRQDFSCYAVHDYVTASAPAPPPTSGSRVLVPVILVCAAGLLGLALGARYEYARKCTKRKAPAIVAGSTAGRHELVSSTSTLTGGGSSCDATSDKAGVTGVLVVHEGEFTGLRLDKVIGRGGFSEVWRGSFRGSDVAVKVLHRSNNASSIDASVQEEANLLTCLRHPSICTVYGVSPVPLTPGKALEGITGSPSTGIVLEYLSGGTLSDYLKLESSSEGDGDVVVHDPARLANHLRIALQVASGLQYLHSKAIIHRDIKASNILLDASFKNAKVADFGLSRLVGQDTGTELTTGSDRKAFGPSGTLRYLAPESAIPLHLGAPPELTNQPSSASASSKSPCFEELRAVDIYAWSYLLYEILHESVAFREFNGLQAFMLALQGQRPAIRLPSSLASLKKLIEQCWHADGSQRPTMAQNAVTLDAIFTLAQAQGSSFKAQSLASLPEQNGAAQV